MENAVDNIGIIKSLMCAVIGRAFAEASNKAKVNSLDIRERKDALLFINSSRLDKFIDTWQLDLNAEVIRKKLKEVTNGL